MNQRIKALLTNIQDANMEIEQVLKLPVAYLRGIGQIYSNILQQHGYEKIADLLEMKNFEELPISRKLLIKWQLAARIIQDMIEQKIHVGRILFSGLANAGKTSIIHTLKHMPRPGGPTLGAKKSIYQIASHQIVISDMGGQQIFREQYVDMPEHYFADVQVLFYVIDVLSLEQFNEAMSYLEQILSIFRYLNEKPKIGILMHKYDPDKAYKLKYVVPPYTKKIEQLFEKYSEFEYQIFYTSIFDPPSLFVATSKILAEVFPVMNLISGLIEEFALSNNFDGLILLDDQGVIISQYLSEETSKEVLSRVYEQYNKIKKERITSFTSLLMRKQYGEGEMIVHKIYFPKGIGYAFIWLGNIKKSAKLDNSLLNKLTKNLNPWLFNLLYSSKN